MEKLIHASKEGRCLRGDGILDYCSRDEIIHLLAEAVDEDNRLKENDRAAVEPVSSPLPPTEPTVPPNPCEGSR